MPMLQQEYSKQNGVVIVVDIVVARLSQRDLTTEEPATQQAVGSERTVPNNGKPKQRQ